MTTYRVRGWEVHYETSESRKVKGPLKWIALKTQHDGKRFRRLMRRDETGSLYGVWCLIVQVAAKCPNRGVLADEDGPLTACDIADKTDLAVDVVQKALAVFAASDIRWLEPVDSDGNPLMPAGPSAGPTDSPQEPVLQDITEQNLTEPDITRQDKQPACDGATAKELVESWNKIEGVCHVRGVAGKRGNAIKARLSEPEWRDNWQAAMERVNRSSFCKGSGIQRWVADFDWFVRPDTLTKILEGKYDDRDITRSERSANVPGQTGGIGSASDEERLFGPGGVCPPAT